jgi:hypothetical protein
MRETIEKLLFASSTGLGSVALVLMGVNAWMGADNNARQAAIDQRADFIAAMTERSRDAPLVRDLLIAAQKPPNEAIRALLTKHGVAFEAPASVANPASAAKP